MHQYVVGLDALKTMIHMLSDELDRGAKSVYLDATEARVHFKQDVTIEHVNTITGYKAWHQFSTFDHREDVEELVFPQLSKSYSCLAWLTQAYFVSHGYMCRL